MTAYVALDSRRLFPREAAASLPLQARLLARMSCGRLSDEDLKDFIAQGALPAKDDPDAINAVFSQGW